jgi:hypothetical protein
VNTKASVQKKEQENVRNSFGKKGGNMKNKNNYNLELLRDSWKFGVDYDD